MDDVKEWVSISHTAAGATSAKVVLSDGVHTARWAVKCFGGADSMREGIEAARTKARVALAVLREASE